MGDALGEGGVEAAVAQISDEVLRNQRSAGLGVGVRAGQRGHRDAGQAEHAADLLAAFDDLVFELGKGVFLVGLQVARCGRGSRPW